MLSFWLVKCLPQDKGESGSDNDSDGDDSSDSDNSSSDDGQDGKSEENKVPLLSLSGVGARCSAVVKAFAHGAMGRRVDPSWDGPIELFLVPASAPQLSEM